MRKQSTIAATAVLAVLYCNSLVCVEARRPPSGGRAPQRGASSSRRGGSGVSGGNSRVSSASRSKRRSVVYDDEDEEDQFDGEGEDEDEDEEMSFGFLDDNAYDEEEEEEEEEDLGRGRGGRPSQGGARNKGRGAPEKRPARGRSYEEQDYDVDDYDMNIGIGVDEEEDEYDMVDARRGSGSGSGSGRGSSSGRRGPSNGGRNAAAASASATASGRRGPSGRNTDRASPGGRSSRSSASSARGSGGGGPSRGRDSRGGRSGNVVPYGNSRGGRNRQPQPTAFSRGLAALKQSIPDPTALKDTAFNSISAARETTSKLTGNIYREVKGLTSSELEQVMLKATAPNDVPVKGKHVERLVGVTYQISGRYDIYDAVLRKLWSKMVEKDWRTTVKSLYILHRFSADGAPDHQAALKARLRELRRTRDPKRGKEKYFNSKQLLSGDTSPATIPYRAFLSRYAHYVLLRAQCFGGVFTEIANDPNKVKPSKSSKSKPVKKCITSTCLKNEHLEAAQMLLKAGLACELKSNGEEECENTAIALERVVSDLIGLTTAVATALNNALRGDYDYDSDMDWDLIAKWCEFYSSELLVQTKGVMKRTTPTLDAYGLFLPSRMGVSVSQDLLQKGLKGKSSSDGTSSDSAAGTDEKVCKDEAADLEEDRDVQDEKERAEADLVEDDGNNNDRDEVALDEKDIVDEDNAYDAYDEEYEYEEYEYE